MIAKVPVLKRGQLYHGVKGCGEAGAVDAFPAVTHAILDALATLGIGDFAGPATPERVWRPMRR